MKDKKIFADQGLPPAFKSPPGEERIGLGHGAGGRKMHRLITELFVRYFGNPALNRLEDSAVVKLPAGTMCFTTDSYVVKPLFFPGGDIGKLAVCGTVNDLAVTGAEPQYLAVSFVLREGLTVKTLERVCRSMAATAKSAGVMVVTGDTKVIEGGGAVEEMFITTSGIGVRPRGLRLGLEFVRNGDIIVLSGGLGEHEAAVAIARGGYHFRAKLASDCAPLNRMIRAVLKTGGVRVMRDPTRGGLATTLNEIAEQSGVGHKQTGSRQEELHLCRVHAICCAMHAGLKRVRRCTDSVGQLGMVHEDDAVVQSSVQNSHVHAVHGVDMNPLA
ncbi:MAG: hydrogenase expression/formation protein HypE, partial [candidate division WOR-3 bacterium]|nr:hydrogenase expression/formation protein HypE [candidate division WOR-3 bacterium]